MLLLVLLSVTHFAAAQFETERGIDYDLFDCGTPVAEDLTGDGLPEFITTGRGGVRFFTNLGGGQFDTLRNVFLQDWSRNRVVFADLDGDGLTDALAYDDRAGRLYRVINAGNGCFQSPILTYGNWSGVFELVGLDYDGDGDLDLAYTALGGVLGWLENTGGFNFTEHPLATATELFRELVVLDVVGDERPELLAVDGGSGILYGISHATGGGATPLPLLDGLSGFADLVTADMDSDGQAELLVKIPGTLFIGTRAPTDTLVWTDQPFSNLSFGKITPGDLDGDGDVDLLLADVVQSDIVYQVLNDGNDLFGPPTPFSTHSQVDGLLLSDMTGDGLPDALVTAYSGPSYQTNLGAAGFAPALSLYEGYSNDIGELLAVDVDQDGDQDLVAATFYYTTPSAETLVWYENQGGHFGKYHRIGVPPAKFYAVRSFDHDGDGLPDLLAITNNNQLLLLRNQGDDSFAPPQLLVQGVSGFTRLLDLDQDGRPEVVSSAVGSQQIQYAVLPPTGPAGPWVNIIADQAITDAKLFDLDADGTPELVLSNNSAGVISYLRRDAQGAWTDQTLLTNNAPGVNDLQYVDLNHDGREDLLYASYGEDAILGCYNLGGGVFAEPTVLITGEKPWSITAADFDGNGRIDLLPRFNAAPLHYYSSSSFGNFFYQSDQLGHDDGGHRYVTTGDFDGDQATDVVAGFGSLLYLHKVVYYRNAIAQAAIGVAIGQVSCDDNATPTNPADDRIRFSLTVSGSTGSYTVSAGSFTPTANTGVFDTTTEFVLMPGSAGNGPVSLTVSGAGNNQIKLLPDPGTCSQFAGIAVDSLGISCANNNTPTVTTDDRIRFMLQAQSSAGSGSFTLSSPDYSIEPTTGSFGELASFLLSPGSAGAGDQTVTLTADDGTATTFPLFLTDPGICSSPVLVSAEVTALTCDDQGTPDDPSDDYRLFTLTLSRSDGASGGAVLSSNQGYVHPPYVNYGLPTSVLAVQTGTDPIAVQLTDTNDPFIVPGAVTVDVPQACTNPLVPWDITSVSTVCADNGTPDFAADDYLEVTLTANVSDGALIPYEIFSPAYGSLTFSLTTLPTTFSLPPGSAGAGDAPLYLFGLDDASRADTYKVSDPGVCSAITVSLSATTSAITCLNNETPADPADDYLQVDLLVTGSNVGTAFNISVGGAPTVPATGTYGQVVTVALPPGSAGGGDLTISVADLDNAAWTTSATVADPGACSAVPPALAATVSAVTCDDNETGTDPNDDRISFELVVNGGSDGTTYLLDVSGSGTATPAGGVYGESVSILLEAGSAGGGNRQLTIADATNPALTTSVPLTDPGNCSATHTTEATVGQLAVAPNPSRTGFTFQLPTGHAAAVLRIYRSDGCPLPIRVAQIENTLRWNAEAAPAGCYLYRLLLSDGTLYAGRLVKL